MPETTTTNSSVEMNTEQTTPASETIVPVEKTEDKTVDKKYTDEDLNNILAKQKSKWEKDAQDKMSEASKLAKMNADEKAKYELEKAKSELSKRESEITKRELSAEAKQELATKGLPIELAEVLDYTSAETVKSTMEAVEKAVRQSVESMVNERLKGNGAPKNTSTNQNQDDLLFRKGAGL